MLGTRGRWLLAGTVVAIATIGPGMRAEAQTAPGPGGVLLDEIGPDWTEGDTCRVLRQASTAPMACFERNGETLVIHVSDVAPGTDARRFEELAVAAYNGATPLATPGLDAANGFDVAQRGDLTGTAIVVATARHVFTLDLTSPNPPAATTPFLIAIAHRQQDRDGGPPPASPAVSRSDEALDRFLLTATAGSGLELIDTVSPGQTYEDLRPTARSQRVVDLLNNVPTRQRVFQVGPASFVIITLSEQPYGEFAALELGAYRDMDTIVDRRPVPFVPHAVGYRFRAVGQYGAAFRRGRYIADVAVAAPTATPDEAEALVDSVAFQQAGLLPAGGTAPSFFPSMRQAVTFTIVFTTLLCVGTAVLSRLVARSRVVTGAPEGGRAPVRFGDAVDVSGPAARLRRSGWFLLAGQVVAVNLVVLGVLVVIGALMGPVALGAVVIVGGLVAGVAYTAWRGRVELTANGGRGAPARGAWRSPLSLAGGLLAVALLVAGMALVVIGLASLAFSPSLRDLERSKTIGLGPTTLAVLTALVGLVLLVVGAVFVRLARLWARTSAARRRQRDRRPPILYLRSFDDDALPLPAVLTARRPFLELFLARGSDPFEEALAWELAPYGPVVAVGRPGRPLSSLGAARDRLPDDEWQRGVAQRMGEAHAVVMVLGATDGVRWELSELVRGGGLTKTVFVFPPVRGTLDERWRFTAGVLSGAGVLVAPLPVEPSRILLAVVDERAQWHVAVADRRDEATYRVAVDQAMAWLQSGRLQRTTSASSPLSTS